jgi:kynurenine formamidase
MKRCTWIACWLSLVCVCSFGRAQAPKAEAVHDLSLLVTPKLPCVWPTGMMQHVVVPTRTIGPGPVRREIIFIDEHTGTQWDAPAHFVPPPDSGLPGAGPTGLLTGEKVPVWQFVGEACVIDVTEHVDDAAAGASFLITPEIVQAWEERHRPLGEGDVVLFRSGYSDRYYKPFPEGYRFVQTALRGETAAWPAPLPQTMKYLGDKGVMAAGLDSPSMGPLPDLAAATHQAGGQYGMIWTECAINLGTLPATGAAYVLLPAKHAGGSGSEARAVGITDKKVAARIIASARARRVVDLSVTLHEDYPVSWPGHGPGDEAGRYVATTLNRFNAARGPFFALAHVLDSQAGTHLVSPSASLPEKSFDLSSYDESTRELLARYESQFGKLGRDGKTVDQVPLHQLMGTARVIDVSGLVGSTAQDEWPASPRITVEHIREYESKTRPIQAGEVVLFRSGHSDRHFQPLPAAPAKDPLMAAPLAGEAEGWPGLTPAAVVYLAEKGVRCLGTDGPTLGGVEQDNNVMVNWAAASRDMYVIELLTSLDELTDGRSFFIFAPIKVAGAHGGYGRALGLN